MSPETQALAKKYLEEVIASGICSGMRVSAPDGGPFLQLLERETESYFGIPHALAVSSATTGLETALQALGVGPADSVLVSGVTMTASAAAAARLGATPIFVDVDPQTGLVTPDTIKEALDSDDHVVSPKALVLVHLFGQVIDLYPIRAHFPNLLIVEDCAQAPACVDSEGVFAGTLSDVGVLSLNQHKVIQCGEGGICITDNDETYERMKLIRNHAENHSADLLGSNFRMTELEAAVGYAEITELFSRQQVRKDHSRELRDLLIGNELVVPQAVDNPPYQFYAIDQTSNKGGAPPGWRRGYATPLCCIPYFKSHFTESCMVGAHVFNATVLCTDPPESLEEAESKAEALNSFYAGVVA